MFSEYYCQKYFLVLIFRGPHVCGLVPIVSVGGRYGGVGR